MMTVSPFVPLLKYGLKWCMCVCVRTRGGGDGEQGVTTPISCIICHIQGHNPWSQLNFRTATRDCNPVYGRDVDVAYRICPYSTRKSQSAVTGSLAV